MELRKNKHISYAKLLAKYLKTHRFETYIVGGYLRDILLNRKPHDIDLATNATPDQIKTVFGSLPFSVTSTGEEFGTLTIYHRELNQALEITTYRKDINTDGRHAQITYAATIEEDLSRRDFTINSLAYNLNTNVLLDLFHGMSDIDLKIIRTIGNPYERFKEDYLRMLRATRFTALDLDMTIHPSTKDAIQDLALNIHAGKNKKISVDRQREELLKGMAYPFPSKMINAMKETGLLNQILPELCGAIGVTQNTHHNIYRHKRTKKYYIKEQNTFIEVFK
jgi:tRNA nucleotidyltransferase (CCA-adding enzyme)